MASCEKCWNDSRGDPQLYSELVASRNVRGESCSPEDQAGPYATVCPHCQRKTVHQVCLVCMTPDCGFRADRSEE